MTHHLGTFKYHKNLRTMSIIYRCILGKAGLYLWSSLLILVRNPSLALKTIVKPPARDHRNMFYFPEGNEEGKSNRL
jgi:hypothetical protein